MKTLAGSETSKLDADCEMGLRDEMSTSELQTTLLHRESLLRGETIKKSNVFTNQDARRHFQEGFVRRHYMLQSSRLFLEEHCSLDRQIPLSPYEATDCAIHVNAYYANLRGALDNLAWVLQSERNILKDVAEDERQNRQRCHLFDKTFINSLKNADFGLGTAIEGFQRWAEGLAELRDPACHRIPIYVPPSVITRQKELEEFRFHRKVS